MAAAAAAATAAANMQGQPLLGHRQHRRDRGAATQPLSLLLLALLVGAFPPTAVSAALLACPVQWRLATDTLPPPAAALCCPSSPPSARLVNGSCVLQGGCAGEGHTPCGDALDCCPPDYECIAAGVAAAPWEQRHCRWASYEQPRSEFVLQEAVAAIPARDVAAQCLPGQSPCLHNASCTEAYDGVECRCVADAAFSGANCSFACPGGRLCATAPPLDSSAYEWSLCPAGSYCPPSAAIPTPPPIVCPGGTFCPRGSAQPTPCEAGSFCSQPGRSNSEPCPAGYYCPNISTSTPLPCPAESFCPLGSAQPTLCAVGSYCPTAGLNASLPCPAGLRCALPGIVTPFAPDFRCPGGGPMVDPTWSHTVAARCCPGGTFFHAPSGKCEGGYCALSGTRLCPDTPLSCCGDGYYCSSYLFSISCLYPGTGEHFSRWRWQSSYSGPLVPARDVKPLCAPERSPCQHNATCEGAYDGALCHCRDVVAFSGTHCEVFSCPPGRQCFAAPAADSSEYPSAPCPAGYYCRGSPVAPTLPLTCPAGSFCPEGVTAPTPCPAGHTCPANNTVDPTPCAAGVACAAVGATESNGSCPLFNYCATGHPPRPCPAGTLCDEEGIADFTLHPCPPDHFCPENGTQEALAFAFYRCQSDDVLMPLVANDWPRCCTEGSRWLETGGGATNDSGALPAPPPPRCLGPRCRTESFAQWPWAAASLQLSDCSHTFISTPYCCPIGYSCQWNPYGGSTPRVCWNNDIISYFYLGPFEAQSEWVREELPRARDTSRHCEQHQCQHGTQCSETFDGYTCACPPLYFAPPHCDFRCPPGAICSVPAVNSTAVNVTNCPSAFYCPAGAALPTVPQGCPPGAYCPTASALPRPCPAGSFCAAGVEAATLCPPGTLCASAGMAASEACPAGSYCPRNGTAAATPCPAGSYCPEASVAPVRCPAGSICQANAVAPSELSELMCGPGFHCPPGSSAALICREGWTCAGRTAEPQPCTQIGYYCPRVGESVAQLCPANCRCPAEWHEPWNATANGAVAGAALQLVYAHAEACSPGEESEEGWGACVAKCGALKQRKNGEGPERAGCEWSGGAIGLFVAVALGGALLSVVTAFACIRHRRRVASPGPSPPLPPPPPCRTSAAEQAWAPPGGMPVADAAVAAPVAFAAAAAAAAPVNAPPSFSPAAAAASIPLYYYHAPAWPYAAVAERQPQSQPQQLPTAAAPPAPLQAELWNSSPEGQPWPVAAAASVGDSPAVLVHIEGEQS